MDMTKYMHHILELDPERKIARVQPGVILDHLRNAAEKHHLTFAPDPATHSHNTLGGMIGNNSCGIHSVMGGKTDDNIEELEILTYDGLRMHVGKTDDAELERIVRAGGRRAEIYARLKTLRDKYANLIRERYPDIPRRVSGYNFVHLLPENGFHIARALVGAEGTCVTVLEATTRLVHSPPVRALLVLGYPDVYSAGDHILEIMEHGPVGLEGIDHNLVKDMTKKGLHPEGVQILPDGNGWLLVEFGGENKQETDGKAKGLMDALRKKGDAPHMKLFDNRAEEKLIWEVRESGLSATARAPGERDTWPGWEDSAVHPGNLGDYLRDLRKLMNKYGYLCSLYGHFGQACVHTRIDFDLLTNDGIKKYRSFVQEAADLVLKYGGSFSGEHGDGQSRGELLPKMFGNELMEAFREFKSIWDPEWKMNPGKVIEPYRLDENLRLGATYNPPQLETELKFPDDKGSFSYATLRCVGVGKCRKDESGTMCPSYMATREEMHSTRGRARMLFEMMQGDIITNGWRDDRVREALDLCLSCKSCKGECPMHVDMAMYKAEFLSHYYKGRLRPPDAYSMGLIYWWSRLASRIPGIVNLNNFFYTETAKAAVEVLEANGFQVYVPLQSLCCGRPLFDYGMIDLARRLLHQVLSALKPFIMEGTPVIGLEPACLSTFREELIDLFPMNYDAQRLSKQSFLLSEFLDKNVGDLPRLKRKAIVHGHCTHKAVMKMDSEERVLSKLGLDYHVLDSGCCGISGAFGFRKGNYDLSMEIGERVLLPAVRNAGKDALIIANGFSCREQIAQSTDRQALHLAQVICMAMHDGEGGPPGVFPERKYMKR
jgi:FAD/FMN-containing dehydrogenase/Fe-S oxidoreductase